MWYKYLSYLMWWALAYYVARVTCVKIAQWYRREEGEVHPFAEVLLGKIFGATALEESLEEAIVWRKGQILACYSLVVLSSAIVIGDIGHGLYSSIADQLSQAGSDSPTAVQGFEPLTAAEHQQLWMGFALYGAAISGALCALHFLTIRAVLWYFQRERVNPFSLEELEAWREARRIQAED